VPIGIQSRMQTAHTARSAAGEDDRALVARIIGGDSAAFEILMRRHNGALFRTARAILRDDADAEDALQEAYLAAYRNLGAFRGDARLSTWLTRIVINQAADDGGTPVQFPDIFMDDVVVQVTDGHNLVGNSNFEGAFTDGWTGGGASVIISSTIAKSGTHSLSVTGRTTTTVGPSYAMPIGAAEYNVVFNALHTGASMHGLVLQSTYTCLGATTTVAVPITTVANLAGNTWTQLGGTVALPPPDAPAGCQLTDAAVSVRQAETGTCGGGVECPDLFVDDVTITLKQ